MISRASGSPMQVWAPLPNGRYTPRRRGAEPRSSQRSGAKSRARSCRPASRCVTRGLTMTLVPARNSWRQAISTSWTGQRSMWRAGGNSRSVFTKHSVEVGQCVRSSGSGARAPIVASTS